MPDTTAIKLDLAKGRVIPLCEKKSTFTLTCRRITAAMWKTYYATIVTKAFTTSEGTVNERDYETGFLTLAAAALEHAAGYTVEGGAELESLPDWQQKVPARHRVMLGRVLAGASVSKDTDDVTIHPEGEAVYLDASWSADDEGKLQYFTGLKHVLASPTEQQFKRFNSEASRSTILGGTRKGTTIYRSVDGILATLYDELVISVDEAYVVNGEPLTGRDAIIREMDYDHKVTAATAIFRPQAVQTADGETEE
jgi:hypothetical protein